MSENTIYEVCILRNEKIVIIYSLLIFYGSMAEVELAQKVTQEAEKMWNEPRGKINLNNETYQVVFQLDWMVETLLKEDEIMSNRNTWKKYFRVEENHEGNISFVDNIPSNTGFLLVKNIAPIGSTTFAHELGHCWGLKHPENPDSRLDEVVHIMCPRGTYVKPEYQYDAAKKVWEDGAGNLQFEQGATLNPIHRKVTQFNIDELQIPLLKFDENKGASLAKRTNIYHHFKG